MNDVIVRNETGDNVVEVIANSEKARSFFYTMFGVFSFKVDAAAEEDLYRAFDHEGLTFETA